MDSLKYQHLPTRRLHQNATRSFFKRLSSKAKAYQTSVVTAIPRLLVVLNAEQAPLLPSLSSSPDFCLVCTNVCRRRYELYFFSEIKYCASIYSSSLAFVSTQMLKSGIFSLFNNLNSFNVILGTNPGHGCGLLQEI